LVSVWRSSDALLICWGTALRHDHGRVRAPSSASNCRSP
jgi:hypothetical protein